MAALLNVTTVSATIVVDGVTYVQSTEDAVIGDVIRYKFRPDDDYDNITDGGYYVVTDVDSSDDPHVDDNDGDDFDTVGDDFTVFKRQNVSPGLVNTVVHNGVTYVLVARTAIAGELVVAARNSLDISIGSVYMVDRVTSDEIFITDDVNDDNGLLETPGNDYFVLEPVITAQTAPTESDVIVHNAVTYSKVARKAVQGDLVVIVSQTGHYIKVGEIVTAESSGVFAVKRDQFNNDRGRDNTQLISDSDTYRVLVPVYHEVKRNATVGDRIRIVAAEDTCDVYANGDEFTVDSVEGDGNVYADGAKSSPDDTNPEGYICKREYVVLEPASPAESVRPSQPARLTVGEYAKVIADNAGHELPIGTVVQLLEDDQTDVPFRALAVGADPDDYMWFEIDDLERTDAPAPTLSTVWTTLGRAEDEYRRGDIVKVGSTVGVAEDIGTQLIGFREFNGKYHGERKSEVTIIASVESRLDTQGAPL